MREKLGRPVVGDHALVKHEHRVVELDMPEAVRDRKDDPSLRAREPVKKMHDLVLGLRVQAAGHLIAEEHRRLADEFHRQGQPPPLPAREHAHQTVVELAHPHLFEHVVHRILERPRAHAPHPEPHRVGHAFADAQLLVRDAELRHVADLRRGKILLRHIPPVPEYRAFLLAWRDPGDDLEHRAFPAARRADDRPEVALRKGNRDIGEERANVLAAADK